MHCQEHWLLRFEELRTLVLRFEEPTQLNNSSEISLVADSSPRGVESVLRQSDPNAVNSLNSVVQQVEAKLGLDLTHKAGLRPDQPPPPLSPTNTTSTHPPTTNTTTNNNFHQQFSSHFALQPFHIHIRHSHPQLQPRPHPHRHPHPNPVPPRQHTKPKAFTQMPPLKLPKKGFIFLLNFLVNALTHEPKPKPTISISPHSRSPRS
ncbi:MADS-box MEF2 type transcription factor MIG1 [Fagus crenata]